MGARRARNACLAPSCAIGSPPLPQRRPRRRRRRLPARQSRAAPTGSAVVFSTAAHAPGLHLGEDLDPRGIHQSGQGRERSDIKPLFPGPEILRLAWGSAQQPPAGRAIRPVIS